ncbi:hypothetical protein AC481_02690 [miscellaneous Crenarchaeota group archaeon SMTZ-80]|nr:MAG: hypothetical protein AC481_02690 [miscellaneous Crenarchaeota group archaeon SMTZ-80]
MGLFAGLLMGGLLGAYWTRPGGWMSGIYGGARALPQSYYPTYQYSPSQHQYSPSQYRYLPQYNYPVYQYPYQQMQYRY